MSEGEFQIDVVIPTQIRYLDLIGTIADYIGKELQKFSGDQEAFAYHLNLVLTEATSNAIRHSSHNDPSETVRITVQFQGDELTIKVYDQGQGFDIEKVPPPDLDHPKEGGMGIFFIKSLMDSVTYTTGEDWNVLEIKKNLNPTTNTP